MLGVSGVKAGESKSQGHNKAGPRRGSPIACQHEDPKRSQEPNKKPIGAKAPSSASGHCTDGNRKGRGGAKLRLRVFRRAAVFPGVPQRDAAGTGVIRDQRERRCKEADGIPRWGRSSVDEGEGRELEDDGEK